MNPRHLDHADTLELPVTGDGPFDFLHTLWKPSHYATGLEAHTATRSWRTFRAGDLVTGVRLHAEDQLVIADIYTDGDYKPAHREHLVRRRPPPTDWTRTSASSPNSPAPYRRCASHSERCPACGRAAPKTTSRSRWSPCSCRTSPSPAPPR